MRRYDRLGILGGSFNPIHIGHMVLADRALEALELDHLLMVPSADTPLKNPLDLIPAADRLLMVTMAVRGVSHVSASDVETKRGGVTYTIDTVEALKQYGKDIFLIIGADKLTQLNEWHRIDDLAKLVTFGVAARPGYRAIELDSRFKWKPIPLPSIAISSTELRERMSQNLSVRHLIPKPVDKHILANGLYIPKSAALLGGAGPSTNPT